MKKLFATSIAFIIFSLMFFTACSKLSFKYSGPIVTLRPTINATENATEEPNNTNAVEITSEPSNEIKDEATAFVIIEPTDAATLEPTARHTSSATDIATIEPTSVVTKVPTVKPTTVATINPKATNTPTQKQTATPVKTATVKPTVAPTATPSTSYFTAYEGYYDPTNYVSVVPSTTYINLFNTRTYYTNPGVDTIINVPGTASDWYVYTDKYGLVSSLTVDGGKLLLKTFKATYKTSVVTGEVTDASSGTGYIYLKNKATYEKAKVYVIAPVAQSEARKQKNSALKYYLYYEKGDYNSFVDGTCCLTVFRTDSDGYYTIPYLTLCSACGKTKELTPTGYFSIGSDNVGSYATSSLRERWHDWGGGSNQYGQYAITYTTERFLHAPTTGVGYMSESKIMKGSYDEVGTHASGGCLRMQTGSIYWIWTHCPDGTPLEIRNLNPLGTRIERPAGMSTTLGYDPTDPILVNYFN